MSKLETTKDTKDTKRELPAGWLWVKLGRFMPKRINSVNPSLYPDENFSLYSIPAFDGGSPEIVTGSQIGSNKQALCPGDVLLSKIVPHIRRTWVVQDGAASRLIGSTEWIIFRTSDVDSDFLRYALLENDFHRQFMDTTSGVGGSLTRARPTLVAHIQIPLPPLEEQRRIAKVLKEQLAAVDMARAAAQARLEAVKALPAAFLRQVFPKPGHPLPPGWKWIQIRTVARVQGGYAFKSEWFTNEGIRLLRNANVFQDQIKWEDIVYLPLERRTDFSIYELNLGDIVLSLDRPIVNNGLKVAKLSEADIPSLLLQRVGRFLISENILSDFLFFFLHSESFISEITRHEFSLGVPHVSPAQVEAISMPLPPFSELQQISATLREQLVSANNVRAAAEAELEAINALPSALIRQAFKGVI